MNYTKLKSEVAAFSHRTDLTAKMDIFTELAESLINKDLRVIEMEKRLEVSFDDTFYDLPTDYIAMRALQVDVAGARRPLIQYSPQQLDERYSYATGTPRAYAIHGGQIEFRPGIEATSPYSGELSYFSRVPTLVSNATNDVLTNYPMIYLAAMMIQVNLYLQDDVEMTKWAQSFNSQVNAANATAVSGSYVLPSIT